jgi:cell division protein FtsA
LNHLLQLTEYITGLNARIGYSNEHLAANHVDSLKNPMYATCLGLILKGYDDYEKQRKSFNNTQVKAVHVPHVFEKPGTVSAERELVEDSFVETIDNDHKPAHVKRKTKSIWDNFKKSLLDLFEEEADQEMK